MSHSVFLLEVALALAGCQTVELELKLYITQARMIRGQTNLKMSEWALSRLTREFKRLSKNRALEIRLDQFRKKRNNLVHQAISTCLNEDGSIDNYQIAGSHLDLLTVQSDARELVKNIHVEHSKLFTIDNGIPIPADAV